MDGTPESGRTGQGGGRHGFLLVPALTFLVGLVLGAALVWVAQPSGTGDGEGSEAQPSPGATASPSTSPSEPSAASPSPGPCVRAAQDAEQVIRLVRAAATALGALDAARLEEIVDEMELLDDQVRDNARLCREASGL